MNPQTPSIVVRITSDNFPLFIALAGAVIAAVAFLLQRAPKPGEPQSGVSRVACAAYAVSTAAVAYAAIYLLQAILSSQRFDISYIFTYSAPDDALLYKFSALWAGGQGSFLVWALIGGLIGIPIIRKLSADSPYAAAFWCVIQACLLLFLVVDDPFARMPGYQPGMVGKGLDALLKNPWIAIHPPLVFIGYALLCVPAALAVQALIDRNADKWVERSIPWALAGWVSLGIGILLGMFWSYEVLGWGGYWKWDPVENASLVPWLIGTALLHGLLLQRRRGGIAYTNVVVAFATFLSVFLATYLTRSGALEDVSVHSFGKNAAASFMTWSLIGFAVVCVLLAAVFLPMMSAGPRMAASVRDRAPATRHALFVMGVAVLGIYSLVVLAGTTTPLFSGATVKEAFYNRQSVPLMTIVLALIALAPFTTWARVNDETTWKRAVRLAAIGLIPLVVALVADLVADLFGFGLLPITLLVVAGVAALASAVFGCVKSGMRRSGAHLAHAGVAIFAIGVVFSSLAGSFKALKLPLNGDSEEMAGRSFSYLGRSALPGNKEAIRLRIAQGGRSQVVRINRQFSERGVVTAPYIASNAAGDLYIAPKDVRSATVRPAVSAQGGQWVPSPVRVPESGATLTLDGLQVESHAARLTYHTPQGKPIVFTVSADAPATVEGYKFSFVGFFQEGGEQHASVVGVQLAVRGHGLTERAVIEVSTKPLIWMVWLGGVLMLVGGGVAFFRRLRYGILPDSD